MQELALWCRELGLMLRNGTDLVAALSVLETQDFGRPIRTMTTEMIEQASGEASVEDLISGRADMFPPVVSFAIRSGRASERIPETLVALADSLEQAADLGMTLSMPVDADSVDPQAGAEQAPVVRIVNSILRQAARAGAREVVIRASEDRTHTRIECSVNGGRQDLAELPIELLGPICRRVCIMAGINWVLKQPGLGTLRVGQREGDLRGTVQFLPEEDEAGHEVRVTLTGPQAGAGPS